MSAHPASTPGERAGVQPPHARPTVAVVPLRDGRSGKTRLAASLSAADRGALVVALARHVVSTLVRVPRVAQVLVVSEDPVSARRALDGVEGQVQVLRQPPGRSGLNAAVDVGRDHLLRHLPAGRLLVVHADLPALEPDDVVALLATTDRPSAAGPPPRVVLAADRAGTGTNALVLDPVDPGYLFRFGEGSLQAHQHEAAARGHVVAVVRRTGTACDLDTVADWGALPEPVRRRVTRAVPAMDRLGAPV